MRTSKRIRCEFTLRSASAHSLPYVFGRTFTRRRLVGPGSRIIFVAQRTNLPLKLQAVPRCGKGSESNGLSRFNRLDRTITIRDQIDPVSDIAHQLASAREAMGYAVYGTRFLVAR